MENKPNNFEDALALSGTEKEKEFFANTELVAQLEPDELNYKKLKVCARAWNTDSTGKVWEPNWFETSQRKYFPWMQVEASEENPAGFGFSLTNCDGGRSGTGVGSRLCFAGAQIAIDFGKTFAGLYKEFWLIPKP